MTTRTNRCTAALAGGNTYRSDITNYTGFETGGYLDKLEKDFEVVSRVRPYLAGDKTRNVRYYLSDNFLNFWFRFIYKYRSSVEIGNIVTNYWETGSSGNPGENNEIDLVAVNEADRVVILGECKRNPEKFNKKHLIDKSAKITDHHKGWKTEFVGLSLNNMSEADCHK